MLGGFVALQLKIRSAIEKREARDAAAETLRKAEVLLLAGKLSAEQVEDARAAALRAVEEYEAARRIGVVGGALLRIPDPSAAADRRRVDQSAAPPVTPPTVDSGTKVGRPRPPQDSLEGIRSALGLENRAPEAADPESLLPSGSSALTLKDVAILFVLLLQVGWFVLSLTDPMGTPNPMLSSALSSAGDAVDQREAQKAARSAEYAAMLREAMEESAAPNRECATRKIGDPLGGCTGETDAAPARGVPEGSDPEKARTRGLDANRAWISGKPISGSARDVSGTPVV